MISLILTFGHSHSASLVWTPTFEMLHKGSGWPRIDFIPYKAHMSCCFIHSGFFISQWPTLGGQYTVTCQLVYLDISVLFLQSALLLLRPYVANWWQNKGILLVGACWNLSTCAKIRSKVPTQRDRSNLLSVGSMQNVNTTSAPS